MGGCILLQKRRLGQHDIEVSVLGLGTVKFGRDQGVKYPAPFTIPSDQALASLLDCAIDCGINLLDTAPAYGMSEERLGVLLAHKRKQFIIATKVGETFVDGQSNFDFSKEAIESSVDRSLKRLKTDYCDIVLVHSNGDDERLIDEEEVFETLKYLKTQGKIRCFGMSTKTVAGGLKTVDLADVVMVTFNPLYQDERAVIQYAQQKNKGVLIKKAFVSGHLDQIADKNPIQHALQFILAESGVSSIVIGTINPKHLQDNVALFHEMISSSL